MDCIVKTQDLESHLKRVAGVQRGKRYAQYVSLEAKQEHMEIRGGTEDAVLSVWLAAGQAYACREVGSGTVDHYPLRRALQMFADSGLIRLRSDEEFLYIADLQHRRTVLLFWEDKVYFPIVTPSCKGIKVASTYLYYGLSRVMSACRNVDLSPVADNTYANVRLTISKDKLEFAAGNGARFIVISMQGDIAYSDDVVHTVFFFKPVQAPLAQSLRREADQMITVYPVIPDERAYMGMSPRKLVEGSEFRFSTLRSGGYINIEKIHNMRMPVAATLGLSSLRPIIDTLREAQWKRRCDPFCTRVTFDFSGGTAKFISNDPVEPLDITVGLQPGLNGTGNPEQTTFDFQCESRYLIEMYELSDRSGSVLLECDKYDTPIDTKITLCRVTFPTQYFDGIRANCQMLITQRSRW